MQMQDVGAASEVPQLSSGASTLTAGHEPQSFWEKDRISSSWITRIYDWLGASILSKKKQLLLKPLPAMSDKASQEGKSSSNNCNGANGYQVSKPDRKLVNSWKPLMQRLSDLFYSSFGQGRPDSTGKEHLQPEHQNSPPAEPKEEADKQNERYGNSENISGDAGAIGGPSEGTIPHKRVHMPGLSKDILRQPYEPFPRRRARLHHGLTKPSNVTANAMLMRYPKRTFSPAHLKKAVPVCVERQPSFALVQKSGCMPSERIPTVSNQALPAQTTLSQAANSIEINHPEAVSPQKTERSSDSGVLGDLDSDENREHSENRHTSARRRRSEQRDRHSTLSNYPETSSSVYSSSEAS